MGLDWIWVLLIYPESEREGPMVQNQLLQKVQPKEEKDKMRTRSTETLSHVHGSCILLCWWRLLGVCLSLQSVTIPPFSAVGSIAPHLFHHKEHIHQSLSSSIGLELKIVLLRSLAEQSSYWPRFVIPVSLQRRCLLKRRFYQSVSRQK